MTHMQKMHAIETKFSRCTRYIEKNVPVVEKYLGDDVFRDKSGDELDEIEEKIEVLLRTIEPRMKSLGENFAEYESKLNTLADDDVTDELKQKTERMADKMFDHEDTIQKLKARLERIRKLNDRTQMLRTGLGSHESLASTQYDAADRLQRLRNDGVNSRYPGRSGLEPNERDQRNDENNADTTEVANNQNVDENGASRNPQVCVRRLTNSQIHRYTANDAGHESGATNADPQMRNPANRAEENPARTAEGQTDAENIVRLLYDHLQRDNRQGGQTSSNESNLRLPKYNLPEFSGNPEQWIEFWDKFDKAVHQRTTLADVEKLQYLQGCCKGDAKKLVSGLPLSNDNYAVACALLRERFGNPSVAIDHIYAKLVELNPVPPRNTEKLREFYFELENSLRRLEALGADAKSNHMVGVILRKLPRYMVAQLERNKGPRQQWSMQLLRQLLSTELEIEEATFRQSDSKKTEKPEAPKSKGGKTTTEAFKAQDKRENDRNREHRTNPSEPTCFYCKGKHWSGECPKYKTAVDRRQVVKTSRCCFVCLRSNHAARDCKNEKPCFHCKKVKMHHASLCPEKFDAGKSPDSARKADDGTTDLTSDHEDLGGLASDEHAVMKTALCDAVNPETDDREAVRVFFDSGTSRSWITEKLAKKLKLKLGRKQRLLVNRFADDGAPKAIEMKEAVLTLRNRDGQKWKIAVAVTPTAMGSITLTDKREIAKQIPRELVLADKLRSPESKVPIDVMIGNDYYDDLIYRDRMEIGPGLRLINSAFGWIVTGRMQNSRNNHDQGHIGMYALPESATNKHGGVERIENSRELKHNLEDLWSLEAIGIHDEPNDVTDDIAIENFNKTVKEENGRYQVVWPWKNSVDTLPTNSNLAMRRLKSQIQRLQKDKKDEFLREYDNIMKDQLSKGVIEEVPEDQIVTENRVHYIPHHGVVKPGSLTTKLRIVYDASAKQSPDSPSLNDCLYRGQVFLENLVVLLIRFRLHSIAIVADIEKAFMQIGIQENDRDVTRFYWVRDVTKPVDQDNLVTYRFTRVSFGVKASPFLLGATILHHLRKDGSKTAEQIENGLYVDNVITGTETVEAAVQLYKDSKQIFDKANMNIREFCSSNAEFEKQIAESDRTKYDELKVLGLVWDRQTDTLSIRESEKKSETLTKKQILGAIHRVYDPLGLICPTLLSSKILLQQLNKKKIHWDEKLPGEFGEKWRNIQSEMKTDGVRVQRYIGFRLHECDRLMCFCDASADAYAVVIYMQKISSGKTESHLVFAKSRVSPIKKMTIPRLELLAVLLGTRMVKFLRQNLPYDGKAIIWSDSQCVLRWIPDTTVTGQFVQNRLREIRKTKDTEFRYVPTKENPADIASRGAKPAELTDLWWHGPKWSTMPENEWPHWEGNVNELENRNQIAEIDEDMCNQAVTLETEPPFGIEIANISSLKRVLRVTVYCQRFIAATREKRRADAVEIQTAEIRNAMLTWIKHAQKNEYATLISDMNKGKRNTTQVQLGVRQHEDDILRCHGRLSEMNASNEAIHPILLPSDSRLTKLIIEECHKRSMHAGLAQTLAQVRQEFWIPRGRTRVKSVLSKCTTCKYFENRAFARPLMPELPASRTNAKRPFYDIGLDYFGPLYTSGKDEPDKRWVCIMTCLSTRAIHLELVKNMSAEEYLLALRRFIARRGKPRSIISDNATQFKAVRKIDPISKTLSGEAIVWKFIPEMTPWAGGVYERLIRSVKTAMKKTLREKLLTDTQLATVLTEVENAVNSRPLTYVTDDINSWKVLTPNDFLGVEGQKTIPPETEENTDPDYRQTAETNRDRLVKLHRAQMNRLQELWQVWQSDYLLSLREALRYQHKDPRAKVIREPVPGEVVIVKDEKMARSKWKIAKVDEVIRSADGKVRSVKVRIGKNSLTRPVNFLYPLEVGISEQTEDKEIHDRDDAETDIKRPRREAADQAKKRIRKILKNESDDGFAVGV